MNFNLLLIILYLFRIEDVYSEIAILKAGITAISPGDMGIIFYFLVENKKNCMFHLQTVTKNCREDHSPECNITLLGNDMGFIRPLETKKIDLVWPTSYVYNRKGSCRVIISYRDPNKRQETSHFLRYKCYFDTYLNNKNILPAFKAVYPELRTKCSGEDLDPLTNCTPVDCLIKYGGCKNFFSIKERSCKSVNPCVYESKDPYNGYIPTTNTCKNIKSRLKLSEVDRIRRILPRTSIPAMAIFPYSKSTRYINNNFSSFCNCHTNWREVLGNKQRQCPYHMCNIQVENWKKNYLKKINNTLLVFGILSVLIAIGVLLLTLCCYCLQRVICAKIEANQRKFQTCDNVCADYNYDTEAYSNSTDI